MDAISAPPFLNLAVLDQVFVQKVPPHSIPPGIRRRCVSSTAYSQHGFWRHLVHKGWLSGLTPAYSWDCYERLAAFSRL